MRDGRATGGSGLQRGIAGCSAVAIAATLAADCVSPVRSAAGRFDALYRRSERRLERGIGSVDIGHTVAPLWDALDDVVLSLLEAGADDSEIDGRLSSLEGFDSPEGSGARAVMRKDDVALPRYALIPAGPDGHRIWMAAYRYPPWDAGRVSVFLQRDGRWTRAGHVDADTVLVPYALHGAPVPTIIVMEHFVHADGYSGAVQAWQVIDGTLVPRGRRMQNLGEWDVSRPGTDLVIGYSWWPACLSTSVAARRLNTFELTITAAASGPVYTVASTAPWVIAVDELCEALERGDAAGVQARSTVLVPPALRKGAWLLHNATGSITAGTATVSLGANEADWRLEVRRDTRRVWQITRIAPGR